MIVKVHGEFFLSVYTLQGHSKSIKMVLFELAKFVLNAEIFKVADELSFQFLMPTCLIPERVSNHTKLGEYIEIVWEQEI